MLTTTTIRLLPAAILALLSLASATPTPPYIGLSIYQGTVAAPCDPSAISFNLKPPKSWLSESPESHCLPGLSSDISNVTCITRRTVQLPADTALDTDLADMTVCDMWGFTETACTGKYWVASKNDQLAGGAMQSWIWTEEERQSGPDVLDIQSWQIYCPK